MGNLTNLTYLDLLGNQLTGPIPPELGNLANLTWLDLRGNPLTGPIPPQLGQLTKLKKLYLNSTGLSGPLPRELIGLPLEVFSFENTEVCVPRAVDFQEWLNGIDRLAPLAPYTHCRDPQWEAPDLAVEASVSQNSLTPGQSFTLNATVRNQGNGQSAATSLRWYRSDDATISTRDTQVGTDPVSSLAASGTSSESISLRAPSSAGTYYYGACVESVSDESDTGNNCSSAVTVNVGAAPAPDLVVDSPSVSTSSPTAGASFWLRATVRNQGTGRSAATTLRFYRSTNATISDSDTEVGSDAVSGLAASGTSDHSTDPDCPIECRHLLLRRLRRERQRRIRYRQQLLRSRYRKRGRRPCPGSRR